MMGPIRKAVSDDLDSEAPVYNSKGTVYNSKGPVYNLKGPVYNSKKFEEIRRNSECFDVF